MTQPIPNPRMRRAPRLPMPGPGGHPGNPSGQMRPAPTQPVGGRFGSTPPVRQQPPAFPPMPQARQGQGPRTMPNASARGIERSAVLSALRSRLGGTSGGPGMLPPRRRPVIKPR